MREVNLHGGALLLTRITRTRSHAGDTSLQLAVDVPAVFISLLSSASSVSAYIHCLQLRAEAETPSKRGQQVRYLKIIFTRSDMLFQYSRAKPKRFCVLP